MIPFEGFPHVLESQQFSKEFIEELFQVADAMRLAPEAFDQVLKDILAIIAFGEVSTRTFTSFDISAKRLGAIVSGNQSMNVTSSVAKGESFDDTIRNLLEYGPQYLIIRWPKEGSVARAAELAGDRCVVINAGDGPGQHPTQALLDLYTIWRHFKTFDRPIVIGFVGDNARSRTSISLTYLMAKLFPEVSFFFISPESCRMKPEIIDYLKRHQRKFTEVTQPKLYELADAFDVLYITRPQLNLEPNQLKHEDIIREYQKFILTPDVVERMKPEAIVMHPLPRTFEVPDETMLDPRIKFFEQAGNGLWIRMALLERIHHARTGRGILIPG